MSAWIKFSEQAPPETECVLVTNNPAGRDRYGGMSHCWLTFPVKSGNEWVAFDDAYNRIHGLQMWHSLPPPPTE